MKLYFLFIFGWRHDELKLNRLRIFQAAGLGILFMYPLEYLLSLFFPLLSMYDLEPSLAIILLAIPAILVGELVIGYWIGRHVTASLFFHVFLVNILIVLANTIITYIAYGVLKSNVASALIMSLIFAWPMAVWVRKRRGGKDTPRFGKWR
jgi:hypothetical protein